MTISVSLMFHYIVKLILTLIFGTFTYMVICWPINDQPTSRTQYGIWFVVLVIIIDLLFFNFIKFTR